MDARNEVRVTVKVSREGDALGIHVKSYTNPRFSVAVVTAATPSFVWANSVAFCTASAKPAGLVPVAWADPGLPPPLPLSSGLMSATHSLAFKPRSLPLYRSKKKYFRMKERSLIIGVLLTLGTAAKTITLLASRSTLKKIAAVSGDKVLTCFKAPSKA